MKGGAFLNSKEGRVGFRTEYYDVTIKVIALFYFEGNIHAKVTGRRNKTKYVLEFFTI